MSLSSVLTGGIRSKVHCTWGCQDNQDKRIELISAIEAQLEGIRLDQSSWAALWLTNLSVLEKYATCFDKEKVTLVPDTRPLRLLSTPEPLPLPPAISPLVFFSSSKTSGGLDCVKSEHHPAPSA